MRNLFIIPIILMISCSTSPEQIESVHYPFDKIDSIIDSYKRDTIFPIKKLTPTEKIELKQKKRELKREIRDANQRVKCMTKCGCVKGSGYDPENLKKLRNKIKRLSITVDSIRTVLNKQSEL